MLRLGAIVFALCAVMVIPVLARDLTGVAAVNVTSDTAAAAKDIAFNRARRQIIVDVLRPYAVSDALQTAVVDAKSADLMNLISASSIDGEQLSDTTYSAKISMTVDAGAAQAWLDAAGVKNWLNNDADADTQVLVFILNNRLADWTDLQTHARAVGVDFATQNISGNSVTAHVPASRAAATLAALRADGWRVSTDDGVVRVWR